mgnify:CR=1 FL=1
MTNVIINASKYIILFMMILYAISCYTTFRNVGEEEKTQKLNQQIVYVFVMHFLAYLTFALRNLSLIHI